MFKFIFYRTLNSQSAVSVTVANLCGLLRSRGYDATMTLLEKKDSDIVSKICENKERYPILIYKVNSMDQEKTFPVLSELAKKKMFSKIYLIGPFASLNGERIMKLYHWVDGVILGTGEYTVLELARRWKEEADSGRDTFVEGGIWRTDRGGFVRRDIDRWFPLKELPCPERDIERTQKEKIANLEFSRGCENMCRYCHMRAYHEQYGLKRECKTVDQVMEDMENLYALGKRYFVFNDSVFWNDEADTSRLLEWCRRIETSGMKIFFMIYLSLYHFPPMSLIEKLKAVGLIRIFIGVESFDQKVLQIIKQESYPSFRLEGIREKLGELYISCHIGYIVFFPFSTLEQVEQSIEYLNSLGKMFRVGIMLERLRLIPYTPMEQYMERSENMLDGAYAYKIVDERAERLQKQWMDIFEIQLHATYIKMELLCTAGDLAMSILMRDRDMIPERVRLIYDQHRSNIEIYSRRIYCFVRESIDRVRSGQEVLLTEGFERDYYASMESLQNSWRRLYKIMSGYTKFDLEKMIPTGDGYDEQKTCRI